MSELWYTEKHFENSGFTFKVKKQLVHDQSDFQTVDIYETESHGKMLCLDGLVMLTERDEHVYHEMIAHTPLQLLKYKGITPEKVLVIGGGDGGTIREVLDYPSIKKAVLCEIDGMVVEYCKQHIPLTSSKLNDPRVEVIISDGIEYVKKFKNEFDLVIVDSTDPIGPAEGLFGTAFYQAVSDSLKPQGLAVAQSESYFFYESWLVEQSAKLKKIFPFVRFFKADIPTYPSGTWCFVMASKSINPLDCMEKDFTQKNTLRKKYYHAGIHQGSFSLPASIEDAIY